MKSVVFSVLLLATSIANAGNLLFHLESHHSELNKDETEYTIDENGNKISTPIKGHNNNNFGIGYKTDKGYLFGTYRNSFYKQTIYIGAEFMYNKYIGGLVGVATGYKVHYGHPIMPFAAGLIKVPLYDETKAVFSIVPKSQFKNYEVISLTIETPF